jgi:hypothetical protein
MDRIKEVMVKFENVSFQQVFKENEKADKFSKEALML